MLGYEVSQIQDDALRIKAQQATIFARCSPEEKNRIIFALKSSNNVVGYLGDGINDAPSLKTADVGISVDTAVDVAKESADLVLTKKSLRDLKEGIIEGRKTFGNTMKYVMMTLSSNFGNMFSATGALLFLPFLPMLPVQILLNNLIYDFSQVTIPSDHVDKEWAQKPKRWNLSFIKKFMYVFGPISSLFDFFTFYVLFTVLNSSAAAFQTGWFMESLATQTLVIHVIRTKRIPFFQSMPSALLTLSGIVCIGVGWILPYTSLGGYFGFVPLPLHTLGILLGIIAAYLITVHIVKVLFYKVYDY
jgi:Mg2+-importing ATPase